MQKYFYIFVIFLLILLYGSDKHSNKNKKVDNIKIVKLAKVNKHIITNQVLGKKSKLFFTLNKKQKRSLIEKLINDELLIQYILKKKDEKIILDENLRVKRGLHLIEIDSLTRTLSKIDDKNLSKIYNKNKAKYWHKELIEASNILVDTEKKALTIIAKLNETSDINSTFKKLAKQYSLSKEAKFGGYLGLFEKRIMIKSFQNAIDQLKIGSYTKKPIKTKYGYHIIYLHAIKKEGYFSLEEVKQNIVLDINKKNMNKWAFLKLKEVKKDANITYYIE